MNYSLISEVIFGSAVGAGLVQLLPKFLEKFFVEWREKSIRKQKEKRHCLDNVIAICTEASSNSYKNQPRDKEHILRIITDLEMYDENMSKLLEKLFTNWQLITPSLRGKDFFNTSFDSNDIQNHYQLIKETDDLRRKLIKQAQKARG